MRNEQVLCDRCGNDLTYTTNSVDYRIVVASEGKPARPSSGACLLTDIMIYPPLDRAMHFCGLECLRAWAAPRATT